MNDFPDFTPIQIGHSLEWYRCPVCLNLSNLRWQDERGGEKVLGCNAVCAGKMLRVRARLNADTNRLLGLVMGNLKP